MDVKLVGRAVQHHGVDLLRTLSDEQQEQPSAAILSHLDRRQAPDPEIKDEHFQKSVCTFIGRKSDLLFRPLSKEEKERKKEDSVDDSYAIMPAMEAFMDVPSQMRREHLYKSLRPDDCVTGVVSSILDNGLRVHLLCVDKGCARDIAGLDIVAFCPAKELPKLYAHESALDAFQERDIVRGIVLNVVPEAERIIISLHQKAIPDEKTYPRIGLITEDEFPVYYRRISQIQGMTYEEMLHSILGFNNQGNIRALTSQQGIRDDVSHLRCHARLHIPEKEYAEGLKKWQSQKLAHQSVAQGVDMFKDGKFTEAMQYFNRALQIDAQNVEALVARGALYANKESFNHAIQDFEEALSVNPNHNNARNYLIETLLNLGKMCEDESQLEEACEHYLHVLKIDPNHVEAKEMLAGCQRIMAFQALSHKSERKESKPPPGAESPDLMREKGKKKSSSPSVLSKTTEKLKQLIQEDERDKPSSKKKRKGRTSSSASSRDRHKKRRRRLSSSSGSSSSSSSSSSSGSSRSSRGRKRSKQKSRKSRRNSDASDWSQDNVKSIRLRPSASLDRSPVQTKSGQRRSRSHSPEHKERKERDEEPRTAKRDKEDIKNSLQSGKNPDQSLRLGTATLIDDDDPFARKIQGSAAASFMPVSSFDYFSSSTSIPGLGSPPPSESIRDMKTASKPSPLPREGQIIERERPQETSMSLRRDDFLMAERQRFYQDNRDRYRRSRSRSFSSSPSRSSRRSGSTKRHRSRTKSPVITGVKELDMYLGGAKKLLKRAKSSKKDFTSWESFTMSPSRGRRSVSRGRSRSRSWGHGGSKGRGRSKSRSWSPEVKRTHRSKDKEGPGGRVRSRSGSASRYEIDRRVKEGTMHPGTSSGYRDEDLSRTKMLKVDPRKYGSQWDDDRFVGNVRGAENVRVAKQDELGRGAKFFKGSRERETGWRSEVKERSRSKSRYEDDEGKPRGGKREGDRMDQSPAGRAYKEDNRNWDRGASGGTQMKTLRREELKEEKRDTPNRSGYLQDKTGKNVDVCDKMSVNAERKDKSRDEEDHRTGGDVGKFGPGITADRFRARDEKGDSVKRQGMENVKDKDCIYKEDELLEDPRGLRPSAQKQKPDHPMQGQSSEKDKSENMGFMPRILRMAKMDDPSLNKPLLSSNQLAALERERRSKEKASRKEGEKGSDSKSASERKESSQKKEEDRRQRGSSSREKGRSGNKRSRSRDRRSRSRDRRSRNRRSRIRERRSRSTSSSRSDRRSRSTDKKGRSRSGSNEGGIGGNRGSTERADKSQVLEKKDSVHSNREKEEMKQRDQKKEDNPVETGQKDKEAEETVRLKPEDIEKEIERRVQERLKAEEAKLKKEGEQTAGLSKSRWDEDVSGVQGGKPRGGPQRGGFKKSRWDNMGQGTTSEFQDDGQSSSSSGHTSWRGGRGRVFRFGQSENRGRGRGRGYESDSFRGRGRGRGKGGFDRGRGDTYSYGRGKERPRGGPKRGRHIFGGGRHSSSKSRSRSRSRSHSRSASRDRRRSHSRDRRSRSRDSRSRSSSGSRSKRRSRSGEREAIADSVKSSASVAEYRSGVKPKGEFTRPPLSKWDAVGSDEKLEVAQAKGNQSVGKSPSGSKARRESLSELEKFLLDLKQQKKKQWIAEGKVKEKD